MNPVIEVQMLIRQPISKVFQAFIDPEVTTKFWFSTSTGRLEQGKTVQWHWHKYQATAEVKVLSIVENRQIQILWGEPRTAVDFIFEQISESTTYLKIRNYDIPLQGGELIAFVMDSTGGFTTVVDALKVYLEHGISLALIEDKFPPF
ncbi:SRPBCC family protein [Acinetobacter sp. WZC-1]|uniref:SRPBCC family protein n=1 Tax=Acinetobacter sp. WZC-1 TaxID=3459034 RepID=UPI00403D9126